MNTEHIAALLRRQYQHLPPYHAITGDQVKHILDDYQTAWKRHYPEEKTFHFDLIEGESSVAGLYYAGQEGAVAWATVEKADASENVIRHVLDRAAFLNLEKLSFGNLRDPFGLGWSGLPTSCSSLIKTLEQDFGYHIDETWVLYEYDDLQNWRGASIPGNSLLRFEHREHPASGEWDVFLHLEDRLAGACNAWDIPAYFSFLPKAEKWMSIEWIGLESEFLKRGLGYRLLNRQMIWQQARGMKKIILWTEFSNHSARRFFTKWGFREVDQVVSLVR